MIASPEEQTQWVEETWAEVIRESPLLNVWQFAAEQISFDEKMGNITGPYRPDLTPFNKLFQEAITSHWSAIPAEDWWLRELAARGEKCDEAFYLKSSQSGVTQAALNGSIYIPKFAPGRLLYALPSREKAKNLVRIRVIPFLRQLCGHAIEKDEDVNLTFIELRNMLMEFGGSFSAAFFSEKPLRYGFADDVEYMVSEGGVPGMLDGIHVIDHIRSRFTTADNSFMGVFSRPDLESSEFITNWRGGSQHGYHVSCPHCGARQMLEPEGFNYDHKDCKDSLGRYDLQAVEALTTYRCAHCHADIDESRKYEMNLGGIWIPKSLADRRRDEDPLLVPRRLSLRINDLYSPFPKVKWGILARLKIEAENNPEKLKFVITNHWARPWREKAINLKADQVRAICAGAKDPRTGNPYPDDLDEAGNPKVPAYKRGQLPFIPLFISATSDVQGDQYKWTICGWKLDGTCALIEYGACLSTKDLEEMMGNPLDSKGDPIICLENPEKGLIIEHGLIDSGHDTYNIYDFCIRTGWIWYPSKGVGGFGMSGRSVEGREDFYEGTPILRYHYNDYVIKVNFYKHKIERAHHPKNTSPRLYLPSDVGDDFILEHTAESLRPVTSGNLKRMEWVHDKKIAPNDWPDAMKMQFVIWQIVGPAKQAEHLQALAEAAQEASGADKTKI